MNDLNLLILITFLQVAVLISIFSLSVISQQLKKSKQKLQDSSNLLNQSKQEDIPELSHSNTIDHSFAKRVADEIVRMTTNLSRMDESIKGIKQLSASARKLEQSLNANHYELENLLNKSYDNGMNLQATFIEDENLKEGESIITRIIKPQINYKGKLIQAAQVEVSQGL